MAFDEQTWREATTWPEAEPPDPREVWRLVTSTGVAPSVRARARELLPSSATLKAGIAQALWDRGRRGKRLADDFYDRVGVRSRPATVRALVDTEIEKRARWNNRFANLVSGRFTELVFEAAYRKRLDDIGLELIDETELRSFLDYRIAAPPAEQFEISINVKNAGRQMREARRFFGLDPEDTLPMATYKAFGSAQANIPPLVYVYLVDWTLLERLRAAYWRRGLTRTERSVFQIFANFKGLPRNLEDAFIEATVGERLRSLREAVGYTGRTEPPFRAISAAKCHAIFYEQHDRSPYVFRQRMDTDPNVHISVAAETVPFSDFISEQLATRRKRQELLRGLSSTKSFRIPNPPV